MKKILLSAHVNFLNAKICGSQMDQKLQSYLGILSHANQHTLSQAIKNAYG